MLSVTEIFLEDKAPKENTSTRKKIGAIIAPAAVAYGGYKIGKELVHSYKHNQLENQKHDLTQRQHSNSDDESIDRDIDALNRRIEDHNSFWH